MRKVVFYSWQSDLPNPSNRGFIQKALENVAAEIRSDGEISVEPVIDRDTKGVAGSPDIASTIFDKISVADVFVADISIISTSKKDRATPNPNVLIELGYALKGLGSERVILVFNEAFGKLGDLPFDLKMRRLVVYNMPAKSPRSKERKNLEKQLSNAIRLAVDNSPNVEEEFNPLLSALEEVKPNRVIMLRKNLSTILDRITSLEPVKHSEGGTGDQLIESIDSSLEVATEYARIAETVAVMNDQGSAREIYRWFGNIFELYDHPRDHSGRMSEADCDYFKFLGHEFSVILFAFLVREKNWGIIQDLLDDSIPVKYLRPENGPGNVYWDYASQHLRLLANESINKEIVSVHAGLLSTRHSSGELGNILPLNELVSADYFLFLRGELEPGRNIFGSMKWRPWSCLYLHAVPEFIMDAERNKVAVQLANVFKSSSVDELKQKLLEKYTGYADLYRHGYGRFPIKDHHIQRIGSRD